MCPGQAAEFNPLKYVRQLGEVIGLHETHRYPVWATAAQTICKVLAILGQTAHWTEWDRKWMERIEIIHFEQYRTDEN